MIPSSSLQHGPPFPNFHETSVLLKVLASFADNYGSEWSERRITVHRVDSYSDKNYRVWFFYVAGSPPKAWGSITAVQYGFRVRLENMRKLVTKYVDLYLDPCSPRTALYNVRSLAATRRLILKERELKEREDPKATNT